MFQNFKRYFLLFSFSLISFSCGIYSFTGSSIPTGVETFQVDYFENTAGGKPGSTVEPGLDRDFTIALQDLIVNQTSLNLVCLLYTSPSPRDVEESRMPSSA